MQARVRRVLTCARASLQRMHDHDPYLTTGLAGSFQSLVSGGGGGGGAGGGGGCLAR